MGWGRNRRRIDESVAGAVDAIVDPATSWPDLDAATDILRDNLPRLSSDHPGLDRLYFVLGDALRSRFYRDRALGDLRAALDSFQRGLTLLPPHAPQRGLALTELALLHVIHFHEAGGARSDLKRAASACEEALELTGPSPVLLTRLAHIHQQAGEPGEQIRCAEQGLTAIGEDGQYRPLLLALLADGYEDRYEREGDHRDLDAAVAVRADAVNDGVLQGDDAVRFESNLSYDLLTRYHVTRAGKDLEDALSHAQRAVAATGEDHPIHAELLSKLAMVHSARFALIGDDADLDRELELAREARRTATSDYASVALFNLVVTLTRRFDHRGDYRDLDAGIDLAEEALAHPSLSPEARATCLAGLGVAHRKRFERFGAAADLDQAIQLGHRAMRVVREGDRQAPKIFTTLADTYVTQFGRSRDPEDMDTAISLTTRALAVALPGELPLLHTELAGHHLTQYQVTGDAGALHAAIEHSESAVAGLSRPQPQWAHAADVLAGALMSRSQANKDPRDFERAVQLIEEAVATTHPAHLLGRLQNLAVAYQAPGIDIVRKVDAVGRLLLMVEGAPAHDPALLAATQSNIGQLALQARLLPEAATALRRAVELLPQCAPFGLSWTDQEHQLSSAGDLVSDATAVHLAIGDIERAVELAETGRGTLLSHSLDTGTELDKLESVAPDLASEFRRLTTEITARARLDGRLHDLAAAPGTRISPQQVTDDWSTLLNRIRELPGWAEFLRRPTPTQLRRVITEGAIVLVTAGTIGGGAVVLRDGDAVHVPLPNLTLEAVRDRANVLAGIEMLSDQPGRQARVAVARGADDDMLAWLWDNVTGPVLDAIGAITAGPTSALPRIWWVATGSLGLLPLHAAGIPDGLCALDRVVSSYTPTIDALVRTRKQPGARTRLAVAVQHTAGMPDLPATAREADQLRTRYPDTTILLDAEATADSVLAALPNAGWAHFGCHATSHPLRASASGLYLHDRVLRVPEIGRAGVRDGELAYLSACSTGQSSLFQADQAMHLASAFRLAGYRHVVATLWPVNDEVAAMAARRFYRSLGDAPTADGAAVALHEVTVRLRARFPRDPALWAPFVHYGP
jgi:tetratricopeptide (TPR) repeat protein